MAERPKGSNPRVLMRVFGFLAPYKARLGLALVALLVTTGASLALGQGLRLLVDKGFAAGDSSALDAALIGLVGLSIVLSLGTFARFYLVSWLGERVVADIRVAVFSRVLALNPGFFELTKTGEVLSRLTTDTTLLQSIIGSSASMALRNALGLIGALIMLFVTNVKLTLLLLLVVPVVVIPVMVIGRRVRRLSRQSQDRIADVGSHAEESLNAIRTVQAFTHEPLERENFGRQVANAFGVAIQRTRLRGGLSASVIILVFSAISFVLWVGGNDVMAGRMTPGELAAFVFYGTMVSISVGVLSEVWGQLLHAAGATERLVELLDERPVIVPPEHPVPLPSPLAGRVTFDAVSFRYPSRTEGTALLDFSLDVASGETVALVGPSGAGKSTVFQLLLRFYDPLSGGIRIDGVDIREADPFDVRRHIALVPQEPVIFSTDAFENIRYGDPSADFERVREAARDAAAADFIETLPDGYQTFLGEKGVRLSGGERQRIAIARAILRDPRILLLDEATSALDSANETLIQQALGRLMQGRTTLIIAHRLATVLNADRICVLDQGRIVAVGTHDQLIAENRLYANLYDLQFAQPDAGHPDSDLTGATQS
jgi:ATP-binding cassette subfamily B protein